MAAAPLALAACSGGGTTANGTGGSSTGTTATGTGGDPAGSTSSSSTSSSSTSSSSTSSSSTSSGSTSVMTALAAGSSSTCVARSDGKVVCWGANANAELGNFSSMAPVIVNGLVTAPPGGVAPPISTRTVSVCAVTSAGGAVCWGDNSQGQLGNGSTTDAHAPTPVTGLGAGVTSVAAGDNHGCAVVNGGVQCWGSNDYGKLGDNLTEPSTTTPVFVHGLTVGTVAVIAGSFHTCALTDAGGVQCWGADADGELGDDGANMEEPEPVPVYGLSTGVRAIATGDVHTCAITTGGAVKCWGLNDSGQLGDGTRTTAYSPVDVQGLSTGIVAIAAGSSHTCAVTAGGTVKCWGLNTDGQVGSGSTDNPVTAPVDVPGLSSVVAIAAGHNQTCVATSSGALKCWGANGDGQLGDGTTKSSATPVDVGPLP